jgi:hypothetical protein
MDKAGVTLPKKSKADDKINSVIHQLDINEMELYDLKKDINKSRTQNYPKLDLKPVETSVSKKQRKGLAYVFRCNCRDSAA